MSLLVGVLLVAGCGDDTAVTRGDPGAGAAAYQSQCASCHGAAGEGVQAVGPPLVDPMYDISVYSDAMLVSAVRNGATTGAWDFPLMPAMPGLSDETVGNILAAVRRLQPSGS